MGSAALYCTRTIKAARKPLAVMMTDDRRIGRISTSNRRWTAVTARNRVHGHEHVIDQSITCAYTDKQRLISHDASFDRSLSSTTKQDLLGGGTKPELRGGHSLMRVGLMNCCLV